MSLEGSSDQRQGACVWRGQRTAAAAHSGLGRAGCLSPQAAGPAPHPAAASRWGRGGGGAQASLPPSVGARSAGLSSTRVRLPNMSSSAATRPPAASTTVPSKSRKLPPVTATCAHEGCGPKGFRRDALHAPAGPSCMLQMQDRGRPWAAGVLRLANGACCWAPWRRHGP